ncbi:hypothetical protein AMTRI_Chr06g197170 [Amborella trichopoda]
MALTIIDPEEDSSPVTGLALPATSDVPLLCDPDHSLAMVHVTMGDPISVQSAQDQPPLLRVVPSGRAQLLVPSLSLSHDKVAPSDVNPAHVPQDEDMGLDFNVPIGCFFKEVKRLMKKIKTTNQGKPMISGNSPKKTPKKKIVMGGGTRSSARLEASGIVKKTVALS